MTTPISCSRIASHWDAARLANWALWFCSKRSRFSPRNLLPHNQQLSCFSCKFHKVKSRKCLKIPYNSMTESSRKIRTNCRSLSSTENKPIIKYPGLFSIVNVLPSDWNQSIGYTDTAAAGEVPWLWRCQWLSQRSVRRLATTLRWKYASTRATCAGNTSAP